MRYYFNEKKSQNKKYIEIPLFERANFMQKIRDIAHQFGKKCDDFYSVCLLIFMITRFETGVLLPAATLLIGTSTLVSG